MELFYTAVIMLVVVLDPLGNAAVFAGLTHNQNSRESAYIAVQATAIALGTLLFFGFVGGYVMDYMGIHSASFRIAGGVLLFHTAFHMIMGGHADNAPEVTNTKRNIAVFPMAIPLMAGPGCATATILLFDMARREEQTVLIIVAAIVLTQLAGLACLFAATGLRRYMGSNALSILARVTGIFLAALAIQFISDGLKVLLNL